ncbi:MAG: hypothetical protein DMG05_12565 [Acidobacteria bacterium]|nr:MAG: hypothetical protein DMG05_12565 [Acidobacteriota bacterium]
MRKSFVVFGVFLFLTTWTSFSAEKIWVGKISDSMCGVTHKAMEHEGKKVDDHECTVACVKQGAQYVFVNKGKVYTIENQDVAGLEEHAGHTVKLTGEMSADAKSIKVSSIAMPSGKKKKEQS